MFRNIVWIFLLTLLCKCKDGKVNHESKRMIGNKLVITNHGFFTDSIKIKNGKIYQIMRSFKNSNFDINNGWVNFDSLGNVDFVSTYYPSIRYNYLNDSTTEINFFLAHSVFKQKIAVPNGEIDGNFQWAEDSFNIISVDYSDTLKYVVKKNLRKEKIKCHLIDIENIDSVSGVVFFLELPWSIDDAFERFRKAKKIPIK